MKTLNIYVTKNLLIVFTASIVVMSFIVLAGQLIKMLDLLSSGVSFSSFAKLFLFVLPETLSFSIPVAVLVAVILVFSKMSAENEISALRAGGVSVWQITAPALILSITLSVFCLYFQLYLKPKCKYYLSNAKQNLLLENPSAILSPGATVNIGDFNVTIGERDGDKIAKVSIVRPVSDERLETIYGRDGNIEVDDANKKINLHLNDVIGRIVEYKLDGDVDITPIKNSAIVYPIDIGRELNEDRLFKRSKYLDFNGLIGRIRVMQERKEEKEVNELLFQLNQGIVLALSPLAFVVVAMPFGFRSARSETSIGLVISLGVIIVYFTTVLLMKNFDKYSYAHILIWLPNLLFMSYGIYALKKITKT